MGWSEGKAIGRAGAGRVEPLELNLKTGRAGLGVDEQRRRAREAQHLQEEQDRAKRARQAEESQQRYHAATRASHASRRSARHLRGAWRVAEQLAEQQQHQSQQQEHPGKEQEREQEARTGGGGSSALEEGGGRAGQAMEALSLLLQRLPALQDMMQQEAQAGAERGAAGRDSEPPEGPEPAGCCGQAVTGRPEPSTATWSVSPDDEALAGAAAEAATMSATQAAATTSGDAATAAEPALQQDAQREQPRQEAEPPSLAAQLEVLLLHLRHSHCYCYFCGTAYDGPDDMDAHCPGLTEDEH